MQIKSLAAADDGGKEFMRLCCCKKEFYARRRLFKALEKRIEGLFCEHVDLVDDVDLAKIGRGCKVNRFIDLPDIVDAAMGGSVNLNDSQGAALIDLPA